jgi:hypothetical protein
MMVLSEERLERRRTTQRKYYAKNRARLCQKKRERQALQRFGWKNMSAEERFDAMWEYVKELLRQ